MIYSYKYGYTATSIATMPNLPSPANQIVERCFEYAEPACSVETAQIDRCRYNTALRCIKIYLYDVCSMISTNKLTVAYLVRKQRVATIMA